MCAGPPHFIKKEDRRRFFAIVAASEAYSALKRQEGRRIDMTGTKTGVQMQVAGSITIPALTTETAPSMQYCPNYPACVYLSGSTDNLYRVSAGTILGPVKIYAKRRSADWIIRHKDTTYALSDGKVCVIDQRGEVVPDGFYSELTGVALASLYGDDCLFIGSGLFGLWQNEKWIRLSHPGFDCTEVNQVIQLNRESLLILGDLGLPGLGLHKRSARYAIVALPPHRFMRRAAGEWQEQLEHPLAKSSLVVSSLDSEFQAYAFLADGTVWGGKLNGHLSALRWIELGRTSMPLTMEGPQRQQTAPTPYGPARHLGDRIVVFNTVSRNQTVFQLPPFGGFVSTQLSAGPNGTLISLRSNSEGSLLEQIEIKTNI
jgi:hypothetical protein